MEPLPIPAWEAGIFLVRKAFTIYPIDREQTLPNRGILKLPR